MKIEYELIYRGYRDSKGQRCTEKSRRSKKGVRRIKVVSIGETIRDSGVSGSMYWARKRRNGLTK